MINLNIHYCRNQLSDLKTRRTTLEYEWTNTLKIVRPNRLLQNYFANQPFGAGGIGGANNVSGHVQTARALYDNRGATNSSILASYLHSSLTNPHDNWMNLHPQDTADFSEDLEDEDVNLLRRFQLITNQCHLEWQSSNFHRVGYTFFKGLVDIGNSCITNYNTYQNNKEFMVFDSRSMFNVYFMEDMYGNPDYVYCIYNRTAAQILEQFAMNGKDLMDDGSIKMLFGDDILKSYKSGDTKAYTFVHYVSPTYLENDKKKSYSSVYFLYDYNRTLNNKQMKKLNTGMSGMNMDSFLDTGFFRQEYIDRQPYIITRIRKTDGEDYGNGYSMECTPLLAQLQQVQRSLTIMAQKNSEPPINAPTKRLNRKYSTNPNAINYMDFVGGKLAAVGPTIGPIDMSGALALKEEIIKDIDRTFLIDKIQIENVRYNRTAQEVQKRTGEEIKILSPFIGALESDFLRHLIANTLDFLARNGSQRIKETMSYLKGLNYGIKFVSDIAYAQMRAKIDRSLELFGIYAQMAEVDQRIKVDFNTLGNFRKILFHMGDNFDTLRLPSEAEELLDQQATLARQANEKANLEAAKHGSEAALKVEQAQKLRNESV